MQRLQDDTESNKAPFVAYVSPLQSTLCSESKIDTISDPQSEDQCLLKNNDVLCGRGSVINKHVGNLRFRRMIAANKEAYANCEKNSHKFFMALSIVIAIEGKGGRFVRRRDEKIEDSILIQISRKDAVSKTAQALRDTQLQGNHSRRRWALLIQHDIDMKEVWTPHQDRGVMDKSYGSQKFEVASYNDDTSCASGDNTKSDDSTSDESMNASPSRGKAHPLTCFDDALSARSTVPQPLFFHTESFPTWAGHAQPMPFESPHPMVSHYPGAKPECKAEGSTSRVPQRDALWIPAELEALMFSDPNVVQALATLE